MRPSTAKLVTWLLAGGLVLYLLSFLFSSSASSTDRQTVANLSQSWRSASLFKPSKPQQPVPGKIEIFGQGASTDSLRANESTSALPSQWSALVEQLQSEALRQFDELFSDQDLSVFEGFPGTAISNNQDASRLQSFLDCSVSKGAWVYDTTGELSTSGLTVHKQSPGYASCDKKFYKGRSPDENDLNTWDVRESLKYRWRPSSECSALLPSHLKPSSSFATPPKSTLPTRQTLCGLLHYKYVLLAGDQPTQYFLHDLLLDWTNDAQDSCYGDLYCGLHSICSAFFDSQADQPGGRWLDDVQPYDSLAMSPEQLLRVQGQPPVAKLPLPKNKQDYWTALRYRRTDGLWLDPLAAAEQIDPVYIHPQTGVREINQYVAPDVRRSDLVVLSKPPLPLPLPTSSLALDVLRVRQAKTQQELAAELFSLAQKMTRDIWLPEALQALYAARFKGSTENLVVWRGNWRIQPGCSSTDANHETTAWSSPGDGPTPYSSEPDLAAVLFPSEDALSDTALHAIFYNVQATLQNFILRKHVLPSLGMPYLDMETPMSIWRSGMLGGVSYDPDAVQGLHTFSPPSSRNCLEPCIPTPGMSAEEGFIGGLTRLLQSGWGTDAAKSAWTGKGYTPVRKRSA